MTAACGGSTAGTSEAGGAHGAAPSSEGSVVEVGYPASGPRDVEGGRKHFERGVALASSGDHRSAIAAYAEAIRSDPAQGLAYLRKAESHLASDEEPGAVRTLLERAVQLLPANPQAHLLLAQALLAEGDLGRAEKHLTKSIGLKNDSAETHVQLATLFERTNRPAEAKASLERAVAIDPKRIQARVRLGELLAAAGDSRGAAEQVEAAARVTARSAELYRRASRLYEAAGDAAKADEMRALADKIDPPEKARKLRPLPPARSGKK